MQREGDDKGKEEEEKEEGWKEEERQVRRA